MSDFIADKDGGEDRAQLVRWLKAQQVDYRSTLRQDDVHKDSLVPEFSYVLSRGVYAKQHTAGPPNACQVHLRLAPGAGKVTWMGGLPNAFSGGREVALSDVLLVSVGKGTAGIAGCRSAEQVDPACCMSLVLPHALLTGTPQSLNLEFATPTEVGCSFAPALGADMRA